MLRNFVDIIGITDPADYPIITTANPHVQYIAQETLVVPTAKPDVEQVNSLMVEATITDARPIVTPVGIKVVIDGMINQKIMYTANDLVQSVHTVHDQYPFCTFIEVPLPLPAGVNAEQFLQTLGLSLADVLAGPTSVIIEDATVLLLDPRTIEKCIVLFLWTTLNAALVP